MKIKLQIFNNNNGPDFFFCGDICQPYIFHIFNLYGPSIQNYRFDIPFPIYYQRTNLSLRQCFVDANSKKQILESHGRNDWSVFETFINN